jgi:hypothetical protein
MTLCPVSATVYLRAEDNTRRDGFDLVRWLEGGGGEVISK